MIHERKKIARIVEELTLFFFALGADKIQSGIEEDGKNVVRSSNGEILIPYSS